jgi:hypothetical protein
MIEITGAEGPLVEVRVAGKVTHADYQKILPEFEAIVAEHGTISCLMEMGKIESIEPRAVWDDAQFDIRHARQFGRVAVVTGTRWHEWMTRLWGVFIPSATVRCFAPGERAEALAWARGG